MGLTWATAVCVSMQVCLVAFTKGKMTVLATAFDRNLGGLNPQPQGFPDSLSVYAAEVTRCIRLYAYVRTYVYTHIRCNSLGARCLDVRVSGPQDWSRSLEVEGGEGDESMI
jgi:hypothetical protein